jgi:hypothetical protein
MTVDEFHAWVPSYERGCWELIDGVPRWRGHRVRVRDIAAATPEELIQLLDSRDRMRPRPTA